MKATRFLLLLLILPACGEEQSPPTGYPPGHAIPYQAPLTPDACGAPTLGLTTQIALTDPPVFSPRLTWGGVEAGLVWIETTATGSATVFLQRLSANGAVLGERTIVGQVAGQPYTAELDVATDGGRYLVCFETKTDAPRSIQCTSLPVGSDGPAEDGYVSEGNSPRLAMGPQGMLLVFHRSQLDVVAVPLTARGVASAEPVTVSENPGNLSSLGRDAQGFAFADSLSGLSRSVIHVLSPDGAMVQEASIDTRERMALAGSSPTLAIWQDSPAGIMTSVVSAGQATTPVDVGDAATGYGKVSAAMAGNAFAVAWSDFNGFIGYRAVDNAGTPKGDVVQAIGVGWDDNANDIVAVSDGLLIVTTQNPSNDQLALVHLGCP